MQRRSAWIVVILLVQLILGIFPLGAQDTGNLLRDPGFEGQYTQRGSADLNIPADWQFWYATAPRTESWMNLQPVVFPHNGPGPNPQSGARAVNMNKGFATFTAALFQQVTVPAGANVTGSAFAYLKTCNLAPGFDNCGSAVESEAFTRVGIDPTGGTDPNSPSILWATARPHDRWEQMTVAATASGTSVTLFIYVTQRWPSQINNVYIDSASLTVGGAGAAVPAAPGGQPAAPPPPPQTVPFVVAQNAREDGSIVHRVQAGDTLDSIAVAYGVTRQALLELNNIADARIITIGQEIIIRPAPTGSADEAETAEETPEPSAVTETTDENGEGDSAAEQPETNDTAEGTAEAAPPLDIAALPPAPVRSPSAGEVQPAIDPSTTAGQVCVLMFDDTADASRQPNRLQDAGEAVLAGGSIILLRDSAPVAEHTTASTDPHCFAELAPGMYVASAAAPDGYGLTTPDQLSVRVTSGGTVTIAFGAAEGFQPSAPPPEDAATALEAVSETTAAAANPLLDNLGIVALAAAGAALIAGTAVTFVLRRR